LFSYVADVDNEVALSVRHQTCDSQVATWTPLHSGLGQATYTCFSRWQAV